VLEDLKEALRADERLAWQDGANCKGANADLFEKFGIWGGLSERERRRIRRERQIAAARRAS